MCTDVRVVSYDSDWWSRYRLYSGRLGLIIEIMQISFYIEHFTVQTTSSLTNLDRNLHVYLLCTSPHKTMLQTTGCNLFYNRHDFI